MPHRKLILYIACSVDGYIAQPGDDLSFLERVQAPGEDYGFQAFIEGIDTVIMGRRTYDWLLGQGYAYPHADKRSFILTRSQRPDQGNLHFYSGDLVALVQRLKSEKGKHIFCDGGAEVVQSLLNHRLIDEIILSIVPVLLGDGIRLFKDGLPSQDMELVTCSDYSSGLVQLHYKKRTTTD